MIQILIQQLKCLHDTSVGSEKKWMSVNLEAGLLIIK